VSRSDRSGHDKKSDKEEAEKKLAGLEKDILEQRKQFELLAS